MIDGCLKILTAQIKNIEQVNMGIENKAENIEQKNLRNRDEERARRREKRKRQVMVYRICITVIIVLVIAAGAGAYIWNLPSLKLSRKLSDGNKYTESGELTKANNSYKEALKIDSGTVEAYRCLARNNIELNDSLSAKEILYTGWENTNDESLLHYYCVVILNEAVAQINKKECSAETIGKCLQVLQIENDNEDALSLLDICYERLYTGSDKKNTYKNFLYEDNLDNVSLDDIFFDAVSIDNISFGDASLDIASSEIIFSEDAAADNTYSDEAAPYENYENQLRALLALYDETGLDAVGRLLAEYAVIDIEHVYFKADYITKYHNLLEDIYAVVSDKAVGELIACLSQAIETQEAFADIFAEFEKGNFESAKEFIVSDTYIKIRDSFINGQSGYWEGTASVPINQEQIVIHKTPDGFKYFWPDYDDCENMQGVITVWGSRQLDDGVQRTTISYEPASQNDEYYPHIEYVISYENSNVLKNGTDVQMNYRFNTTTRTEEGAETVAIGDWGGEHEWSTNY